MSVDLKAAPEDRDKLYHWIAKIVVWGVVLAMLAGILLTLVVPSRPFYLACYQAGQVIWQGVVRDTAMGYWQPDEYRPAYPPHGASVSCIRSPLP